MEFQAAAGAPTPSPNANNGAYVQGIDNYVHAPTSGGFAAHAYPNQQSNGSYSQVGSNMQQYAPNVANTTPAQAQSIPMQYAPNVVNGPAQSPQQPVQQQNNGAISIFNAAQAPVNYNNTQQNAQPQSAAMQVFGQGSISAQVRFFQLLYIQCNY